VRRVVLAAIVSMATLLGAALLWKFRGAAALFLVSLALAAALRPFVEALEPRLGRGLSVAVVYAAGLALLGGLVYVASHGFLREVDEGLDRLGAAWDRLRTAGTQTSPVHGYFLKRLPPAAALYRVAGARPGALLDGLLGFTINAIDVLGRFLIVIALSAYWSASRESFERLWLSLLPPQARTRAREVWRSVEVAVGAHLRSQLGQSLLAILLVAFVFRLAGFPTPMIPALAAGLFRLVPIFGPVIAAAVAWLAGATASSPAAALAAGFTLLLLLLLDRWVARTWFSAPRVSPTLAVFLIVALADAYGMLGLVAATPLAAAAQAVMETLIATQPRPGRRVRSLADIELRIARVRQRLLLLPPESAAPLSSVVARLDALADEARRATAAASDL
jgi:putative permease